MLHMTYFPIFPMFLYLSGGHIKGCGGPSLVFNNPRALIFSWLMCMEKTSGLTKKLY